MQRFALISEASNVLIENAVTYIIFLYVVVCIYFMMLVCVCDFVLLLVMHKVSGVSVEVVSLFCHTNVEC